MRFNRMARLDRAEGALRVAGVALAAVSASFAVYMAVDPDREPQIAGIEHLAIFAKPRTMAAQRFQRETGANIDFTPIGSTRSDLPVLSNFELIDALPDAATLRTPQGDVIRASPGAQIPGVGRILSIQRRNGKWTVLTQAGLIQDR